MSVIFHLIFFIFHKNVVCDGLEKGHWSFSIDCLRNTDLYYCWFHYF